jgi:anti-sigma B factor antagonist
MGRQGGRNDRRNAASWAVTVLLRQHVADDGLPRARPTPCRSTVRLPSGVVAAEAAAEPDVVDAVVRAWRLGALAGIPSAVPGAGTRERTIVLFDVQRREREGWIVLTIFGELDLSAAPRVRQAALQAVPLVAPAGGEPPRVVVDLSPAAFVDSAGLGVVLGIVRRARQAGGQAAIVVDPSSSPGRVVSVLGLERAIPVAADHAEVLARARAGALDRRAAEPAVMLAGDPGGHDG